MPDLFRKVVIVAAPTGLIVQPVHQRNHHAICINYKSHDIASTEAASLTDFTFLNSHGIVGLLDVPPLAYLIAIVGRQQVAQIRTSVVYSVNNVAIIPLSSQADAVAAISQLTTELGHGSKASARDRASDPTGEGDSEEEEEDSTSDNASVESATKESYINAQRQERGLSNVARDVIGRRGFYGRFAAKWFSRKGWVAERRMAQGMSPDETVSNPEKDNQSRSSKLPAWNSWRQQNVKSNDHTFEGTSSSSTLTLLPKLLRTTKLLLSSQNFYFSYDYDITCRHSDWQERNAQKIPMSQQFDPLFFWNHHLMKPFLDNDLHAYVLPIMQGFVGQRSFVVNERGADRLEITATSSNTAIDLPDKSSRPSDNPSNDDNDEDDGKFLLTLISRRSIERPGLRYLRRGIDDQGHAANTVETEQILSRASWSSSSKAYSFVQVRGSIPLFFSQSPYSLKPAPVMQRSTEENLAALQTHFSHLISRYSGDVQVVLLTDKTGQERKIGERYDECVKLLNEREMVSSNRVDFEWFDFHHHCRGMRFDNVRLLLEKLSERLRQIGMTIRDNGALTSRQQGIIRTNCMDCLDRTNVVQTGFGQTMLENALHLEGFSIDFQSDQSTQWFNSLWADNGDAISKQYSSTAALKGDFTRTRKRDYKGAIVDFSLTLSRYYNNIVNDFFLQTAIDFLVGKSDVRVFDDFEANLMSHDPGISMSKIRQNAINTCAKIAIESEDEDLIAGWTLLSPREPNSVRILPLEESILLLTGVALYKVNFDWIIEKVSSFERIELLSIQCILKGVYITSTLTSAQTDEDRNVGFVIEYRPGKTDITRVNTRSLYSAPGLQDHVQGLTDETNEEAGETDKSQSRQRPEIDDETRKSKILAFKALPSHSGNSGSGAREEAQSERELVSEICNAVQRQVSAGGDFRQTQLVRVGDIVSLQDAQKSTGLVEQWTYHLKRMVWG